MATLELRGIKKRFGEFYAVDGVDLMIAEGEFLAILGPSGCGKTTLMRMIAGLEPPTAGEVLIGGVPVTHLPPRARNVSMVFQSYALYPHMTVAENIAFPLKARGVPRAERDSKVQWVVGLMGIEALVKRKPGRLSGGEKQKVALARSLVRDPSLFIFDEPLSSLDAQVRAMARGELRQLHDRTGVTTVYVTHDQLEALGMGDRIAIMNRGRVRQLGTPRELYDDPADTFVASFLGSPPMNMIEYDDHILGFRPEYLLPCGKADVPEGSIIFKVRISQIEFLGSEWLVYGVLEDDKNEIKLLAKVQPAAAGELRAGKQHDFMIDRTRLRYFNKQSGLRMPGPV
ncbi:MAG: ABC transporter ATP-binding protein [Gammaproteobacteria bacterium]|nr:ABC transporter ATP-binding protein [Gammaproteobacteria bacterium]